MGGGGGGGSYSSESAGNIKEALEGSRQRRNMFISFAYEDIDEVNLFRGQAKNEKSDIEFIDRSVKTAFASTNDDYIKQQINRRIMQSSMTAVYLTPNSANSKWVDWEVTQSLKYGREVIAFHKGDSPPANLPRSITDNGIKIVSWSDLNKKGL